MILSYQNKRFCFTEFDDDGNEHSYIWSITDFYTDFPFLPQLDMTEINSISFEDERPLYLIVYREGLNRPAIHVKDPKDNQFMKAIADNKGLIKARAYELITHQDENQEPERDIVAEFDAMKAEFTKLKSDVEILKATKESAK